MKKIMKRYLSFLLSFTLVLSLIPAMSLTAYATETGGNAAKEEPTPLSVSIEDWTYGDVQSDHIVSMPAAVTNWQVQYKLSTVNSSGYTTDKPTEAGLYNIRLIIKNDPKYRDAHVEDTFTIKKRVVSLSWDENDVFVYDGKVHIPNVTLKNLIEGDSEMVSAEITGSATVAGSYTARITGLTGEGAGNYTLPSEGLTRAYSIVKVPEDKNQATLSMESWTYGEDAPAPVVRNNKGGGTVNFSYATREENTPGNEYPARVYSSKKPSAAGYYIVKAEISETDNYAEKTLYAPFVISPKDAVIKWTGDSFDYDGQTHAPTAEVTNKVKSADDVSVSVSGEKKAAGPYEATAELTGKDALNYRIPDTSAKKTFEILPRRISLSWGDRSFTYDGKAHSPEATIENLVEGDDCSVSVGGSGTDAGSHTNQVGISGADSKNYRLDSGDETVSYTIEPLTAELSWNGDSFTYDGTAHRPEALVANLQGTDQCGVTVTGAGTNAGKYTATATVLSNRNYKLPDDCTKLFTIERKPVTIRWDQSTLSFTYDKEEHCPAAVVESGLVGVNDDVKPVVTGASSSAGSHTATVVALEGRDAANYVPDKSYSIAYEIAKADAGSIENPAALSMDGWIYGGDPSDPVITNNLSSGGVTYSYKSSEGVQYGSVKPGKAGTYTVTAVINETDNYAEKVLTANFTIEPRTAVIVWSDTEFVYDGREHVPTARIANPAKADDICTVKVTGAATLAGDRSYTAAVDKLEGRDSANYVLPQEGDKSLSQTFVIQPRRAEISWDTYEFTYDGMEHCPGAAVTNLVKGDECTVTVTGKGTMAGTYTAAATELAGRDKGNYELPEGVSVSYNISRQTLAGKVSVTKPDITYGDEPGRINIVGIPAEVEDKVKVEYKAFEAKDSSYTQAEPVAAGRYTVRVSLGENTNYDPVQVTDVFTIAQKPLSLSWSDTVFIYDGTDKLPTVSVNGLLPADEGSVRAVVTGASSEAGSHEARVISLEGDAVENYLLPADLTAAYEILRADIPAEGEGCAQLTMTGWTYGDNAYDPVIENNPGGGTVTYTYKPADAPDDAYVSSKPSDAGQYRVRAQIAETAGYKALTVSADFAIARRVAQLSWEDLSFIYDEEGHAPVCEVANLVNGDRCEVSVSLDPEGKTIGASAVDAGEYTAYAAALSNANYVLPGTVSHNFTISKDVPYLSVGMTGWTYGDEPHDPVVYGAPEGSRVTYVYYGDEACEKQIEKPSAAGTYYVAAVCGATENYEEQRDVTSFTIEPRVADLAWSGLSYIYDGNEHMPTVTIANLVGSDECTVETGGAAAAAGSYTATALQLAGGAAANYMLPAAADQSFVISKRTAELVWGDKEYVYDGTDKCPTVTVGNVASGDECSILSVLGASRTVGSHIAMAVKLSNDNYAMPDLPVCEFVITKSELSDETAVHIEDWTYGESARTPYVTGNTEGAYVTCMYKAADGGDDSYSLKAPYLAGRYTLRAQIAGTEGYNGKTVTTDFEIRRAEPSADVQAVNPICNDAAQELVKAVSVTGGSLVYAPGQSATQSPDSSLYTESIPTGVDAGTYYVWYMIKGDENHLDSEPVCVTVTMPQTADGIYYEKISLDGVTGEDGKPLSLILRYNTSVSYNGLMHRAANDESAKSKKVSGDINVAINSPLMSFATMSYKYKENKSSYSKKGKKPYYMFFFKPMKGVATKEQKKIIKEVNKKLKAMYRQRGGFEFEIKPADIGRATSCELKVNKKGVAKKVTFVIDGQTFSLKKNMVTTTGNSDGSYTITAAANTDFTGTYVKKAAK